MKKKQSNRNASSKKLTKLSANLELAQKIEVGMKTSRVSRNEVMKTLVK